MSSAWRHPYRPQDIYGPSVGEHNINLFPEEVSIEDPNKGVYFGTGVDSYDIEQDSRYSPMVQKLRRAIRADKNKKLNEEYVKAVKERPGRQATIISELSPPESKTLLGNNKPRTVLG